MGDKKATDTDQKNPIISFDPGATSSEQPSLANTKELIDQQESEQISKQTAYDNLKDQSTADMDAIAHELKDFGRLSMKVSTQSSPTGPVGTMKTIGKLLIDSQDVDNIIKRAESGEIAVNLPSARVISATHGKGILNILQIIDNYEGVVGSILVGSDGLVIASTLDNSSDRDSLGALAHGLLGNTNLATARLDLGNLEQMMLTSNIAEKNDLKRIITVITDVGEGIFAVFLDREPAIGLEQLLEKIRTIANG